MFSRRRLLVTAAAGLTASAQPSCAAEPVEITATPVAFRDDPEPQRVGRLTYRGGVVLNSLDERFGGG